MAERLLKCVVMPGHSLTLGHEEQHDSKGNITGRYNTLRKLEGETLELDEKEARRLGAFLSQGDLRDSDGKLIPFMHKTVDLVR